MISPSIIRLAIRLFHNLAMGSSEPRPPWCAALAIELLSEAFVPVVASSAARAADSGSRARPFDAVADPLVIS